ncbi:MAG: hypothetical protein AAFP03_19725, partial [Cyanobacteria bacterium J06598_3]
ALFNGKGGAIAPRGTVTIDGSRFEGNRAYEGGALFLDGGSDLNSSIVETTFDLNRADREGGAIALTSGHQLSIQRTTLSNNQALQGNGGAIAHRSGGALGLSLSRSTLSGNSAANSGGAIYVGTGALAELSQTTIANNSVTRNSTANIAGGINNLGTVRLQGTIIAANSADYGP